MNLGGLRRNKCRGGEDKPSKPQQRLGVVAKPRGVKAAVGTQPAGAVRRSSALAHGAAGRRSSIKKAVATLTKPVRKSVQQARRNLSFDKSPKKKIATPQKKSRMTPIKLTPAKRHRILIPETPSIKNLRRKSDGNRSISDTPDKKVSSYLNITGTQSEFYSDNR